MSDAAPNCESSPVASRKPLKFPRSARLLRHADFDRVYRQGRRHFAAHLTVFYLLRPENKSLRVGFTVSRAMGGAVDRNRMKRRLREAVRSQWPGTELPIDVVINPKNSMRKIEFGELCQEIAQAFKVIQKFAEKQSDAR